MPSPLQKLAGLCAAAIVSAALLLTALTPATAGAKEISKRIAGARVSLSTAQAIDGHAKRKAKKAPPAADGQSLYWGAWIGEQFTGAQAPWDMNAVSKFE